ncbi:MAG: HAMP domain-containing protein [Actinobacteria bacterium]|nr:HAMP domain-containing protein [Actinomycetota bacterium]
MKKKGKYKVSSGNLYKSGRSLIVFQITALVVVVMLVSGILSLYLYNRSQNRLIDNSKDKLIESEARMIASSHIFMARTINDLLEIAGVSVPGREAVQQEIEKGASTGNLSSLQVAVDDILKIAVGAGFFGLEAIVKAAPPSADSSAEKAVVLFSNNDQYIYQDLPEDLSAMIENGDTYKLFEEGIPQFGMEDEYLVTSGRDDVTTGGSTLWSFEFKPMSGELAAIDAYYDEEKRNTNLALAAVVGGSIIFVLIITFLVLSLLIKRRITKPIDELSDVAEEVMDGDLDIKVPIRSGEEFEGLKIAFNEMLQSLNALLMKSTGQESGKKESFENRGSNKRKSRSSKSMVLVYTTILIALVYAASSAFSFIFFLRSQERLIDKSKERIIRTEAEMLSTGHNYFGEVTIKIMYAKDMLPDTTEDFQTFIQEDIQARASNTIPPSKEVQNDIYEFLIETGLYGLDLAFSVSPPNPALRVSEPMIAVSSDISLIYDNMPQVLGRLLEIEEGDNDSYSGRIDEKNTYALFENGLPELGLSGEYLVASYLFDMEIGPIKAELWNFDFKPMHEELKSLNDYYDKEYKNTLLFVGITMAITFVVLVLISFFILSLLIRRRITNPLNELAAAVEQVMEGDLDIEIPVKTGEEFQGLKHAFNEMIGSIRGILSKTTDCD